MIAVVCFTFATIQIVPAPVVRAPEAKWQELIQSRRAAWESEIASMVTNFENIDPPPVTRILLNATEGRDAYTIDATTIGFDIAKLNELYGGASLPQNSPLIDRLFRHEFTHVMQKAWLAKHPYSQDTPLRAALLDIWKEGMGNYYSLSDRWHGPDAEKTLAHLTPRFIARLAALACGSSGSQKLTGDLSSGKFDEKWGALPAALWLDADGPDAVRRFVLAGPEGVWDLADRHLPAGSRAVLREARQAADLCATTDSRR